MESKTVALHLPSVFFRLSEISLKSFFIWKIPLVGLQTPFVPFQILFVQIQNIDLHFAFFPN